MQETILQLENVRVAYGGVTALDGCTLDVRGGEVVAVMGPNGAGKSTTLKAAFGLAPVVGGTVRWHGTKIDPKPHEMLERGMSFVPQGRRVFRTLSVEENIELGGHALKNNEERRRRREEILELFPVLAKKRKEASGGLSGGQQQLLAIARGLMIEPRLLLLDEPTLGLSPVAVKEVFEQITRINAQHGTAIMVVEHNVKTLLHFVDRAFVLDHGKVAASGDPKDLDESGALERIIMGSAS